MAVGRNFSRHDGGRDFQKDVLLCWNEVGYNEETERNVEACSNYISGRTILLVNPVSLVEYRHSARLSFPTHAVLVYERVSQQYASFHHDPRCRPGRRHLCPP
jgi:hypothetical protein